MRLGKRVLRVAVLLLGVTTVVLAGQGSLSLQIEDVMSAQELKDSGVSELSAAQRQTLNTWLNHYTETILKVAATGASKPRPESPSPTRTKCVPAVESTISGEFHGWDGETIFKLDNGQIWQQAEYDYMYSYSYRPDVTIYEASGGCTMKVEDEDETVTVKRIK